MLSDIEIAQGCQMRPITEVAAGLDAEDLELYGRYKAKLSADVWKKTADKPDGKLVLVTAINPTPAGEGKTTTTVGLGEALAKMGKKAMIALREPSLGPVFGIKGGAAGGGYAQVVPMEDINLHFTGDMHAITAANNLLCAMLDNHMQQGNVLGIDPRRIVFTRVMDMNDRALRNITIGLGGKVNGVPREDHFMITVASEVMAILCLAKDLEDLKARFGRIVIGCDLDGNPVHGLPLPSRNLIKGDARSASIAAASILAKTYRDHRMIRAAEEYPGYGFEVHKGYGTAQHLAALKEHGATPLHRKTFAPVRDILFPPEFTQQELF